MPRHPIIRYLALGAAAALAASCSSGLAGPNGAVAAIQVTSTVDTAVALGDTVPFHATATDKSGATLSGVTFTWTSSAPDVATVSNDGSVVAVGNGVTTIQAAVNGITGSAPFAVRQVAVGLAISLTHDTIAAIGHTVQASAEPTDARGNALGPASATWTSSNPAVATVDGDGLVRGIANGRALIRAEAAGFQDSIPLTMHQYPDSIHIRNVAPYLNVQAGNRIFPQTVEVYDSAGYLLQDDSGATVGAYVTGGTGQLFGQTILAVTGGQATFDSLVYEGSVGTTKLGFTEFVSGAHTQTFLTVQPGPAAAMYAVGGDNQSGTAGSGLELPLKVKVVDAYGNGAFGTVSWTQVAGSGTLGSPVTWLDAYGIAETTYTLGGAVGTDTLLATVDGVSGSPVVFVETTKPSTTSSPPATATRHR